MLYRPNFCCNCGEKIERATWPLLASRRFCELCETEKKEHDYLNRAAAVICILSGLFGISAFVLGSKERSDAGSVGNVSSAHLLKTGGESATNLSAARPSGVEENLTPGSNRIVSEAPAKNQTFQGRSTDTPLTEPVYYCGATTKKGTPCTRRVKTKGAFCWQHAGTNASRGTGGLPANLSK